MMRVAPTAASCRAVRLEEVDVSRGYAAVVAVGALTLCGCGAAASDVDPGDLELRDLLGIAPRVAVTWSAEQRQAARDVLDRGLDIEWEVAAPGFEVELGIGATLVDEVLASIAALDHDLAAGGQQPMGLCRVAVDSSVARIRPLRVDPGHGRASTGEPPAIRLVGWEQGRSRHWADLPERDPELLRVLATRAGADADSGALTVVPAPREPFVAAFVADQRLLLVNPVLLAAAEPRDDEANEERGSLSATTTSGAGVAPALLSPASGNPYTFYGSVNECAASQRERCEICLGGGTCQSQSRDQSDGLTECQTLAADQGRGYYLFCANLALAIQTVSDCVGEIAGCPIDEAASNQLSALGGNSVFVDDGTCAAALEECLTDLYGASDGDFPPPPVDAAVVLDGGTLPVDSGPSTSTPRDTYVTCGENDTNCDFNPECSGNCSTSCNDDEGCGSCNESGCSNCESKDNGCACDSDGDGKACEQGDDSCTACDKDGDGDACNSSEDGCDCSGNSDSNSSCGSSNDNNGCDCGNSSSGDSSSCGSSNSGGSCGSSASGDGDSGRCSVARSPRVRVRRSATRAMALFWALLPLGLLALARRRELRRQGGAR